MLDKLFLFNTLKPFIIIYANLTVILKRGHISKDMEIIFLLQYIML